MKNILIRGGNNNHPLRDLVHDSTHLLKKYPRFFNWLLLTLAFITMLFAYFYVTPQVTGDEPHYLIADQAMAHYYTFDLKAAYANHDYLSYYPAPLLPQGNPDLISMDMAHVYPMHAIGLSVFTLPGYILGSKNGVAFQMILLATAVIALTWLWCKRVTKKATPAYLAAGSLFISYFFIGLSGYIYPDIAIAAILLSCLLLITARNYSNTASQAAIGLLLSFGVFLHYRNLVIAVPVLAILSYMIWKNNRSLPWLALAITVVSTIVFFYSQYSWFDTLNPSAPYGTYTTISNQPFTNVVAMLFDSSRGLFVYNPILILLIIGLPLWLKLSRRTLLLTLLVAGPTMGTVAFFSQWNGGAAPPGRYIIAFLPVLIPSIAFAFDALSSVWQRICISLLALVTITISVDAIANKFSFINYDNYKGTSELVEQLKHSLFSIERYFPSFTNDTKLIGQYGPVKFAFWIFVFVCLLWFGFYLSKQVKSETKMRLFRFLRFKH